MSRAHASAVAGILDYVLGWKADVDVAYAAIWLTADEFRETGCASFDLTALSTRFARSVAFRIERGLGKLEEAGLIEIDASSHTDHLTIRILRS